MNPQLRLLQYQRQAILTASPEQLVLKLYDLGIQACHLEDRSKLRKVLVELITGLNFEKGGEIATRLLALYNFCLTESATGSLKDVNEILTGLRDVWREAVVLRKAA